MRHRAVTGCPGASPSLPLLCRGCVVCRPDGRHDGTLHVRSASRQQMAVGVCAVAALLVVSSCGSAHSGPASTASAQTASTSEPIGADATVNRDFVDEATVYAYEHPDVFAGVGWTGKEYSQFTILVSHASMASAEVSLLREKVPAGAEGQHVEFVAVANSESDLTRVRDILRPKLDAFQLTGLGLDFEANVVSVGASREQIEKAGGREALLQSLQSELPSGLDDAVEVHEAEVLQIQIEERDDGPTG